MPLKQDNITRQLAAAREDLASRTKFLEDAGKSEKQFKKDPVWRLTRARCRKLSRQFNAATAVVDLTNEIEKKRAALASGK